MTKKIFEILPVSSHDSAEHRVMKQRVLAPIIRYPRKATHAHQNAKPYMLKYLGPSNRPPFLGSTGGLGQL